MKKPLLFPLSICLLSLAACGTPTSSDPSSSATSDSLTTSSDIDRPDGSSESSSTSESTYIPPIDTNSGDKAQIYSTLVAAAEGGNYTISYDETVNGISTRQEDAITPNYISRKFSSGGYIPLSSYNPEYGKDAYFAYERKGDSIEVLNAVKTTQITATSQSPIPANKEDDWSMLNPLGNIAEPENRVTENFISFDEANGIYSERQAFIVAMGRALGYRTLAMTGRIAQVRFALLQDGTVQFDLMTWKDALDDDNLNIQTFATGYLSKVGSTSDSVLDAFRSSFAFPSESLSEAASSYFEGNKAKAMTEVTKIQGDQSIWDSSISFESEPGQRKINVRRDNPRGVLDDASYIRKAASGYAEEVFINGNNEIETKRLDYLYKDSSYLQVNDYLDLSAFRMKSDGTYHYYGPASNGIFDSLTTYSLYFGDIRSMEAVLSEDGLRFQGESYVDSNGVKRVFDMKIETPTEISLTPVEVDTTNADYQKLQSAFSYFADPKNPFHAVEINNSNVSTLTDEKRQIGDYYRNGDYFFFLNADLSRSSYGYKAKEGAVQPFSMSFTYQYGDDDSDTSSWHYEGTTSPKGNAIEGKTLSDMMGFVSHPEIFTKVSGNKYGVKAFVNGIGQVMFPEGDNDSKDYDTYFTLDESGRVSTYEYWSTSLGYRKLTFEYEVPAIQDGIFTFREKNTLDLKGIDQIAYTTWETGYGWFYNYQLVRLYKDVLKMSDSDARTAANTIPYLLDDTFKGYAFETVAAVGTTVGLYSTKGSEKTRKVYANKYKDYLLQCGYTLETDASGKAYYAGQYCDIYIGEDLRTSGKGFTFVLHASNR